jgi:hypothetical protein
MMAKKLYKNSLVQNYILLNFLSILRIDLRKLQTFWINWRR